MAASQEKPRGRPRKSEDENAAAEHRRSQIRRAQATFRARKLEQQEAKDAQLKKLEATLQQLSSTFLDLTDYLVTSDAVQKDVEALQKLQAATRQIVALTRIENETYIATPEREGPKVAFRVQQSMVKGSRKPVIISRDHQSGGREANNGQASDDLFGPAFSVETTPLQNVFGNGWDGRVPNIVDNNAIRHNTPLQTVDWQSISYRLLQNTLYIAYWSLIDTSAESVKLANALFRYALLFHSREELLFNLRWFLGPGRGEMHHLANGVHDYSDLFQMDIPILNPSVDSAALSHANSNYDGFGDGISTHFMGAKGVEGYLEERGARFLNDDTIELSLRLSATNGTWPKDNKLSHAGPFSHMLDVFGLDALLHGFDATEPTHHSTASHVVRVRASSLFSNLSKISLCLVRGPGYHRASVDQAISWSIVA